MTQVLVTGARIADGYRGGEERMLEAVLLQLDWERGTVVREDRYVSAPEVMPPEGGRMGYRTAHLDLARGRLLVPTFTEVVEYDLGTWARRGVLSHRSFHDLHHAAYLSDGRLLVVNTGLEKVQWFDASGALLDERYVLDEAEQRFGGDDRDWRRVYSTKPHASHPNHAVELDGRVLVTRFFQRDLVDPHTGEAFVSGIAGNPHDGRLCGGELRFTSTTGMVHRFDAATGAHVRDHDLGSFAGQRPGHLGWCRGLSSRGARTFVGFSCFRKSKWSRVYAPWLKHGTTYLPSRVTEVDLDAERIVREYAFEGELAAMAVFSVEMLPG